MSDMVWTKDGDEWTIRIGSAVVARLFRDPKAGVWRWRVRAPDGSVFGGSSGSWTLAAYGAQSEIIRVSERR